MKKNMHFRFEELSSQATRRVGSTGGFVTALSIVAIWLVTGPLFHFSNTWQLLINTGTTIVTFLMVFLIQRSQNKDALAMQIKLNELIASSRQASNRLIDIEDLSEEELITLEKYYAELVRRSREAGEVQQTHSLDEASESHERKRKTPANQRANNE